MLIAERPKNMPSMPNKGPAVAQQAVKILLKTTKVTVRKTNMNSGIQGTEDQCC